MKRFFVFSTLLLFLFWQADVSLEVDPRLTWVVATMLSVLFVFRAPQILFWGKDMKFMLTMPVPFYSRVRESYTNELVVVLCAGLATCACGVALVLPFIDCLIATTMVLVAGTLAIPSSVLGAVIATSKRTGDIPNSMWLGLIPIVFLFASFSVGVFSSEIQNTTILLAVIVSCVAVALVVGWGLAALISPLLDGGLATIVAMAHSTYASVQTYPLGRIDRLLSLLMPKQSRLIFEKDQLYISRRHPLLPVLLFISALVFFVGGESQTNALNYGFIIFHLVALGRFYLVNKKPILSRNLIKESPITVGEFSVSKLVGVFKWWVLPAFWVTWVLVFQKSQVPVFVWMVIAFSSICYLALLILSAKRVFE